MMFLFKKKNPAEIQNRINSLNQIEEINLHFLEQLPRSKAISVRDEAIRLENRLREIRSEKFILLDKLNL